LGAVGPIFLTATTTSGCTAWVLCAFVFLRSNIAEAKPDSARSNLDLQAQAMAPHHSRLRIAQAIYGYPAGSAPGLSNPRQQPPWGSRHKWGSANMETMSHLLNDAEGQIEF
jgi:hypothetical protein